MIAGVGEDWGAVISSCFSAWLTVMRRMTLMSISRAAELVAAAMIGKGMVSQLAM